jgi:hypothetical protein
MFIQLVSIGFLINICSSGLQRGGGSSPGMVNRQTTPMYSIFPHISDTEVNNLISIFHSIYDNLNGFKANRYE